MFETYGAQVHSIPVDEHGIDIEALKDKLQALSKKPKFLYVTPNFHNPAGIIYSMERKRALMKLLSGKDIILLEDDAYSDLYFKPADKPLTRTMKSMEGYDVEVIYTGSFSKMLGPGFRLGYMFASPEISDKAEIIKQALDACTSNFMQILANEFITQGYLEPYLEFLRKEYLERKTLMETSLRRHLPEGITWISPRGGFYIWLKLPAEMRASDIFESCLKKGVVFVTGKTFDPSNSRDDHIRLSFSNMPKEDIDKGVKILAGVIAEHLQALHS